MKKIWKNQKPIDNDIHFKYRCPHKDCELDHWISLQESQTKNFKVVCSCGTVFLPQRISRVKILYAITKPKLVAKKELLESKKESTETSIPVDILDSCVKLLLGYGFDKDEATSLVKNSYEKCENKEPSYLIKFALQNLENYSVT